MCALPTVPNGLWTGPLASSWNTLWVNDPLKPVLNKSNLALAQHIITASVIPFNSGALQRPAVSSLPPSMLTPECSNHMPAHVTWPPPPSPPHLDLSCYFMAVQLQFVVWSFSFKWLRARRVGLGCLRDRGLCSKTLLHPHRFWWWEDIIWRIFRKWGWGI